MNTASTFARAGLVGLMALTAISATPSLAAAQSTTYYGSRSYDYDPCRRDTVGRTTAGGILGALAGAAIGSNVAGHGVRKEGAVLGALAGAAVGAGIGNSSAACRPAPSQAYNTDNRDYGGTSYPNDGYDDRYNNGYGSAGYNGDHGEDGYGYRERRTVVVRRYEYQPGSPYVVSQAPNNSGNCTLAESPIYLPDGRVQKRFVRVCQDGAGRYQVVD